MLPLNVTKKHAADKQKPLRGSSLLPTALEVTSRAVGKGSWQPFLWQTVHSENRTPQLDWKILFTGLYMVTGGLDGIKGA